MTSTYENRVLSTLPECCKRQQDKEARFWQNIDLQHQKEEKKRLREAEKQAAKEHKKALAFQQQQQRGIERANRDAAFVYEQARQDALRDKKRLIRKQLLKISSRIRTRILAAIKAQEAKKSDHTINLLGCSFTTFKRHMEKLFKSGMSWDNHGIVWHIDHVRPCASFNLRKRSQQRKCFSYKNTQPLFVLENMRKGSKYPASRAGE